MTVQETLKGSSLGQKIGISEKNVEEIGSLLTVILANVQALYIKTRGFHWNLEDSRFFFLHELFEKHYEDLEEESDLIAERLRQIGKRALGSLAEFKQFVTLKEITGELSGNEMLENLVHDYDFLIRSFRHGIEQTTNLEDFSSADMLTQILREFEKRAWMLRSHLK